MPANATNSSRHRATLSTTLSATLTHGARYHVVVYATNGDGLRSRAASPSFVADTVQPDAVHGQIHRLELTDGNVPRFPRFLRVRPDVDRSEFPP